MTASNSASKSMVTAFDKLGVGDKIAFNFPGDGMPEGRQQQATVTYVTTPGNGPTVGLDVYYGGKTFNIAVPHSHFTYLRVVSEAIKLDQAEAQPAFQPRQLAAAANA